ncbi:MAG: hypothetical protein KKD44_17360 [Proteobacteria bacterium]|nr:hypothetical protein [Pseudomonadota bacterium]
MVSAKNICFCFDPDKAGDEWKKLAEEGKKRGKRVFFLDGKTYKDHEDLSALWEHERYIDFTYLEYR